MKLKMEVKMAGIVALTFLVTSSFAYASWDCEVECKITEPTIYAQLARGAGPNEAGDYFAECRAAHGIAQTYAESGCDYMYCYRHNSRVDILLGSGTTVSEARANARSGCQVTGEVTCGLLTSVTVGNYSCKENRD